MGSAGARTADEAQVIAGADDDCSLSDVLPEAPYTVVSYEKSDFVPAVLPVPVGATVTFLGNRYPHTVTSADSLQAAANCESNVEDEDEYDDPEEGPVTVDAPDDTFNVFLQSAGEVRIQFNAAGEFPYYCIPHCGQLMLGQVVVLEAGAPGLAADGGV